MIKQISTGELNKLIGKINIIDVREKGEYVRGHVPGAINVPTNEILNNHANYLNKTEVYYIICHSGGRSRSVASYLDNFGYNVVDVKGGTGTYGIAFPLDK